MQPSSLIFVLVVAIWAVYLLQYWIKRRDHLSTVRSVDRFSAAMRVLDDHRLRREATEPTPRSYAVTPARTARPEVTVKHSEAPQRAEAPQRGRLAEPAVGAPRRVRGLVLLSMVVLLPVVVLVRGVAQGLQPTAEAELLVQSDCADVAGISMQDRDVAAAGAQLGRAPASGYQYW